MDLQFPVILAGLNEDKVRRLLFSVRFNEDLSNSLFTTIAVLNMLADKVTTEMQSINEDQDYWRKVATASWLEIFLTKLLLRGPKSFFMSIYSMLRSRSFESNPSDVVELYRSILRSKNNDLSCLLAGINDSMQYLKRSFLVANNRFYLKLLCDDGVSLLNKDIDIDGNTAKLQQNQHLSSLYRMLRSDIVTCLDSLVVLLNRVYPTMTIPSGTSDCAVSAVQNENPDNESEVKSNDLLPIVNKTLTGIISALKNGSNNEKDDDYPLGCVDLRLRRPSYWQKYWIPLACCAGIGATGLYFIVSSLRSGELQEFLSALIAKGIEKFSEHVIEPLEKLSHELFDSKFKEGMIVTKDELNQSYMALARMLDDYSANVIGEQTSKAEQLRVLIADAKEKFLVKQNNQDAVNTVDGGLGGVDDNKFSQIRRYLAKASSYFDKNAKSSVSVTGEDGKECGTCNIFGGTSDKSKSTTVASLKPLELPDNADAYSKIGGDIVTTITTKSDIGTTTHTIVTPSYNKFKKLTPLDIVEMQTKSSIVMESLMKDYEDELKTPIKGMLFGNLMRNILIQVQELKVHTEAAMLTMDQILASNELTIAVAAAFPSMVLLGVFVKMVSLSFTRKAPKPGSETLKVRLAMVEVERSLHNVYGSGIDSVDEFIEPPNLEDEIANISNFRINSKETQDILFQEEKFGRMYSEERDYGVPESIQLGEKGFVSPRKPKFKREVSQNSVSSSIINDFMFEPFAADDSCILNNYPRTKIGRPVDSSLSVLQAKGKLYFRIFELHRALAKLFHFQIPVLSIFKKIRQFIYGVGWNSNHTIESISAWLVMQLDCTAPSFDDVFSNYSIHFPFQSNTFAAKRETELYRLPIFETSAVSEYENLFRDLLELASPDYEIPRRRKLATATRMRNSYQCLAPPTSS